MTALVLFLAAMTVIGGHGDGPLLRFGGDASPGLLVNLSPGSRPFDPPDRSRPTVVFVHGFNPTPHTVHFTMAERLAEAVARRGSALNVLAWSWNGATYVNLNARVNAENNLSHGRMLAAALWRSGLPSSRTHVIGHSAGAIVAASAARTLAIDYGHPLAQLTLLDPAAYYHDVIFDRLAAGASAARVENYWAPAPSGYGRAVPHPGVRNVRVDGQTPWLGLVHPIRSAHLDVVRWYLATVEDRAAAIGFNASVSAN